MLADIQRDIARDEELAELRAENARLRDLLHGTALGDNIRVLRVKLRIPPAQAWMLSTMFELNGGVLTNARAAIGLPTFLDDPEDRLASIANVHVCRLRKILPDRSMVQTVRGYGYRLSPEGIAWVRSQLSVDTAE